MTAATLKEDDYIIGVNNAEIDRLGFQHKVWRPASEIAWDRAGITTGMTVMDIGCGPGYVAFDLARRVGPTGRVIAIDQSSLFLDALRVGAEARGLDNIDVVEADLADFDWPAEVCDVVWSRWCLSFLPDPDGVMRGIDRTLKPGGAFVAMEYVDYRTVDIIPSTQVFRDFIDAVERSWRHYNGEPNIGRMLPEYFANNGWALESAHPIMHATRPGELMWSWPYSWFEQSPSRMVELGFLTQAQADEFWTFIHERNSDPTSMMLTPTVLEAVGRKPVV
jgi:ubiquinone/menaquinone biosynthesis C-methylase UbiE